MPRTPHRPSSDIFWSQEFADDWNDEHSPRKQLFPDAIAARQKSPTKDKSNKVSLKVTEPKMELGPEVRRAFNQTKQEIAEQLLQELDTTITNGELGRMTALTGGIKIIWSNKLRSTAGRAIYKMVPALNQGPRGAVSSDASQDQHHASIELSDKVIDNRHRLLNVVAHEFCHLANFMVSRILNNPHGKEFKAWGGQVSRAFAHLDIAVTTKHLYVIDSKYAWDCVSCGTQYKRHSKSINPLRHRCSVCRSELRQVKPVPRASADGGPKQPTAYQAFVKEQMKIVRVLNPKTPQKEVMKIVAGRWAEAKASAAAVAPTLVPDESVEGELSADNK